MSPVSPLARSQSCVRVRFFRPAILIPFLLPFFFVAGAFGQANVNESLETANVYVDGATGSDSNPGTESKPLKTIGAAISMAETNNHNSIGTKVTIEAGTYRESLSMTHNSKDTSLPITIEAATNGTVIVSGATIYTGFAEYSENHSIYTTSWTNNWGTCSQLVSTCPFQQEITMRQELIAVNGTVLTQVLSFTQMQQGTFYVDETANLLYVWPASGTNMGTATVEAGTSASLLSISHKSYIVIRGLTFQYANTCHADAAVSVTGPSTNIEFDTDTFQWNNGQGLSISTPATYFTVENSVALHNGDSGFQEANTDYGLWQADTTSYNNWRGAQGAYYVCNTAGFHVWQAHDDTIDGFTISFNEAYGVHWDTDNVNISTSGIISSANLRSGVFVEKDQGPITLNTAYICNHTAPQVVGGLVLRNSEGISLTDSVLLNNAAAEIIMIGVKGGIEVTDWKTGKTTNLVTQNFTNTGNTIQGNSSSQSVFTDSYLDDSDWTSFQTTLVSKNNTWWNANNSSTPYTVPSPKAGTEDDFSSWKSVTGEDSSSSFKQPSGSPGTACSLTPVGTDYWITVDNAILTVKPGKSATFNLALTPLNFTGTVTLTLDGITEVKGLSATLSPSSIKTSGTSVLTVTAGTNTAAGTYSITVIANNGSMTRTVTVQLTVS
ncbi:MAG: DUF1565 domain-containing protein [Candidatus Sulfotelmatobacter sp.]